MLGKVFALSQFHGMPGERQCLISLSQALSRFTYIISEFEVPAEDGASSRGPTNQIAFPCARYEAPSERRKASEIGQNMDALRLVHSLPFPLCVFPALLM